MDGKELEVELKDYENHGVIIRLSGRLITAHNISKHLCVKDGGEYMRDYVFEGGKLKEIRFDWITE
ncbi:hypothetical protein [Eubacterium oxidoreducens]|uniref:Uncharacterized protein n=1 Tax=Eubacterium oxidoreducens TaxID=1732 RepID=A0A1G5ZZQ1_EUBOX|nr:hypothetical protein [Eubacterium oxidoreducens]SDB01684.1 hypothetical protein SAMN02910417_00038 [Eubacterium oxidoreducens]